jgi:hypothetical protein
LARSAWRLAHATRASSELFQDRYVFCAIRPKRLAKRLERYLGRLKTNKLGYDMHFIASREKPVAALSAAAKDVAKKAADAAGENL